MAVFTVDTEAVLTTTASVRATADRLQAEAAAMMAQLSQLQGSWTGSAATAFQTCTEQWRGAQAHVEQALGSISLALGNAATQYSEAETFSANLFRQ
ncbi:WXG100 family type VII secretion target [Microbacterium sp. YY-01]|uniref:WXG100 family type VII secretion target n=1 Tax=Microbacterium sp. YY-01 TaxID=3421634 RepID=UPI003D176A08